MKIKRIIVAMAMASAVVVPTIALGASSAGAAGYTTNFPGNTGTSCNAWHGAPGGFGPNSPYYTVSGAQPGGIGGYTFGQAQIGSTGDNNSGYAAYCNS